MKYKKYIDNFFVDKNIVLMQMGFGILFLTAFNIPTHALYHNKLALAVSLIPTYIGLIIGTISYFKENKKCK